MGETEFSLDEAVNEPPTDTEVAADQRDEAVDHLKRKITSFRRLEEKVMGAGPRGASRAADWAIVRLELQAVLDILECE